MTDQSESMPVRAVEQLILEVRGHEVLLDQDLAEPYGITTKALNQAVSRNTDRFPEDFASRLNRAEADNLRSRTVTSSSRRHGGRRWLPRVFTEEGVAMLSSVLRNERAVAVNIAIMRAFVRVRQVLVGQEALLERLDALEAKPNRHDELALVPPWSVGLAGRRQKHPRRWMRALTAARLAGGLLLAGPLHAWPSRRSGETGAADPDP